MTHTECIPVEALGTIATLPADDPRRRHAETCPRCRARLALFREFDSPSAPPAGARIDEADSALAAAIERELALPAPLPFPARAARPRPARGLGASLRPLWAAAAALILVAGAWVLLRPPAPAVMRGPVSRAELPVATHRGVDRLTLSWRAVPGASRYVVRFYATDLSDLASVDAGRADHLELRRGALPRPLAGGAKVLWQVMALAGGDRLAASRTQPVVLP